MQLNPRLIPVILLDSNKVVKTIRYKELEYVGDPLNILKLFNEKEVDELIILDVFKSPKNIEPDYKYLKNIGSQCFMPLTYGGGINSLEKAERLFSIGYEKVVINSINYQSYNCINSIAIKFGSQSVIGSIDLKKDWFGKLRLYNPSTKKLVKSLDIIEHVRALVENGAGEVMINYVDLEGTYNGVNTDLLETITETINVPTILMGGAVGLKCFEKTIKKGGSALAAGSMFIYKKPFRAVLVQYPDRSEINKILYRNEL